MRTLAVLALLLLSSCGDGTPLPANCRAVGVLVDDNDTVTGTITARMALDNVNEVKYQCQRPFAISHYGCTIALNEHEYGIVYLDIGPASRIHEECHALYEAWGHL